MGINGQVANVIAYLKAKNFVGDEILSLGRQDRSFSLKDLRHIKRNVGVGWTDSQMEASEKDPLAETFLSLSGFKVSRAIDASNLERPILSMISMSLSLNICGTPPLFSTTAALWNMFSTWRHHSRMHLICSRWAG